ncbi:MAG TPA: branched-chain amino acid ABC transporter permease [Pseudolabrys sp.]|jgi:branched-chain amino acid transport system permease protein|nr:branched-chain amino acid ABC transporter permease [Pseudolabrys sp.]
MFHLYFLPAQDSTGTSKRLGVAAAIAGAALLVAYGLFSGSLEHLNTLGLVFMYVVMTQAWNILGGYGGYFNFGLVTFFGIGAYTTALLFHFFALSPFLTAPLAGIASALVAFVIGIPTLRLRGAYFAVVTMIVTFAVQILVLDLPFTQGALGVFLTPLDLSPRATERLFYFVFLGIALAMTVLIYAIENSNFGWALVAIREDEDAAEIIGVRTTEIKWIGNAIAGFATGLVGGIFAMRILYIEPTSTFSLDISLNVVLMTVIGGAGTWLGPLIGAPLVLLVAEALRVNVTSEVNRVIFSLIVIAMALYMPRGLMGLFRRVRKA